MYGSDINKAANCKIVLEAYRVRGENLMVSDPVINDCFMYMCKILHDSVEYVIFDYYWDFGNYQNKIFIISSSLTVEDEVRQISRLIACFIFRVDYGNDLEKYLNFYVEARGAFIRLDYVQSALVQVLYDVQKLLKFVNNTLRLMTV